ncbi:hypothetical protein FRC02_002211 [Tulasnella sp. 418]|nr:hypothetical protein FRC02_002211 [Tulasnella sp. 418]
MEFGPLQGYTTTQHYNYFVNCVDPRLNLDYTIDDFTLENLVLWYAVDNSELSSFGFTGSFTTIDSSADLDTYTTKILASSSTSSGSSLKMINRKDLSDDDCSACFWDD